MLRNDIFRACGFFFFVIQKNPAEAYEEFKLERLCLPRSTMSGCLQLFKPCQKLIVLIYLQHTITSIQALGFFMHMETIFKMFKYS